ncbi:MAG: hypothetical protein WD045_00530 [Pirellulaceae bacterium]
MRSLHLFYASAVVVALFFSSSCSRPGYEGVPTFPVTGHVIIDGEPVEGANVKFTPIAEVGSPDALTANGISGADGSFELSTYVNGDGAPAGEYAVTIFWLEPPKPPRGKDPGPDRLGRRYADPAKSSWEVEIREEDNILEPFKVTTR